MASPLKRKRGANLSSSSSSPAPPSNSTPRRPFAPIFEDSLPSPQPISSSSWSDGDVRLRTQLELSLAELRTSAARIESLLRTLPASSRSALTEVAAPPQPTHPSLSQQQNLEGHKVGCSNCQALQDRVKLLEEAVSVHEKERQAWKEFKSWWLASLAQREKRHRRKHKTKAASSTGASSSTEDGTEAGKKQEDRLSAVVKKLDASTREVWVRAGIVPAEAVADDGVEVRRAARMILAREEARQMTEEHNEPGSMSESVGQQSEVTLPLHAVSPSKTIASTSVKPATAAPQRTTVPHPTTAAEKIGHIDSTPIRSRLQRRTMLAHDCPDCSLFYSHLNNTGDEAGVGDRERSACSRHRTTFERATTPDGYWDIGFPTTQEVEEINASAKAKRIDDGREGEEKGSRRRS